MLEYVQDDPIITEMEINGFIDNTVECAYCEETLFRSEAITDGGDFFCDECCKEDYEAYYK